MFLILHIYPNQTMCKARNGSLRPTLELIQNWLSQKLKTINTRNINLSLFLRYNTGNRVRERSGKVSDVLSVHSVSCIYTLQLKIRQVRVICSFSCLTLDTSFKHLLVPPDSQSFSFGCWYHLLRSQLQRQELQQSCLAFLVFQMQH